MGHGAPSLLELAARPEGIALGPQVASLHAVGHVELWHADVMHEMRRLALGLGEARLVGVRRRGRGMGQGEGHG